MFEQLLRRMRSPRGQSLIEFALVAPIIMVFVLAIVDFGIAIDRRAALDHSVREAGRFAAVGGDLFATGVPATEAEIKAITEDQSQGIADATGLPDSDNFIEVCYEDANSNGFVGDVGDNVQVSVHYKHDFVTGFTEIFNTSLSSIVMTPSANARLEYDVIGADECEPEPEP